ncbi:hypothetical protein OG21DRAFT_1527184 [Imleria badia]|nr:hypothetical protein OG21DRAFT_1527184 [Imleria badia]
MVWNAESHEKVIKFQGHKDCMNALTKMVMGSDDLTVCIRSTTARTATSSTFQFESTQHGTTPLPRCISLANNGVFIAASADSLVFWDITPGEQIGSVIKFTHFRRAIVAAINATDDLGEEGLTETMLVGKAFSLVNFLNAIQKFCADLDPRQPSAANKATVKLHLDSGWVQAQSDNAVLMERLSQLGEKPNSCNFAIGKLQDDILELRGSVENELKTVVVDFCKNTFLDYFRLPCFI